MIWLYEAPNYLMVIYLIHLDFVERSKHLDIFAKDVVFGYGCHGWGVMLLEAHYHVAYQRALRRQESTARFKSHGMPHLTVLETILFEVIIAFQVVHHSALLSFWALASIELL